MNFGIVFVGHGSRHEKASNKAFVHVTRKYEKQRPERDVLYGYLESAEPSVDKAIRAMWKRLEKKYNEKIKGPCISDTSIRREGKSIFLVPLLLFRGRHATKDLPEFIEKAKKNYPNDYFYQTDILGAHKKLARLACKRAYETSISSFLNNGCEMLFLGRGFRENLSANTKHAKDDFYKQAEFFRKEIDCKKGTMHTCFSSLSRPSLSEALEKIAVSTNQTGNKRQTDYSRQKMKKSKRILIVPYLLFDGILIEKAKVDIEIFSEKYPQHIVEMASPLGIDDLLLDVIEEKIEATFKLAKN